MSSPHTFTLYYNLVKIGLGSNAKDNPYHLLWDASMNTIDDNLFVEALYEYSFNQDSSSGYVSDVNSSGYYSGLGIAYTKKQVVFGTGSSYVGSDLSDQAFSTGLTDDTIVNGTLVVFPIIASDDIGATSLAVDVVSIVSGSPAFKLLCYKTGVDGLPTDLIGQTSSWVSPTSAGVWSAGQLSLTEQGVKSGRVVWIGLWTRSTAVGTIRFRGQQKSATRLIGGYNAAGGDQYGVKSMYLTGDIPPASIAGIGRVSWYYVPRIKASLT